MTTCHPPPPCPSAIAVGCRYTVGVQGGSPWSSTHPPISTSTCSYHGQSPPLLPPKPMVQTHVGSHTHMTHEYPYPYPCVPIPTSPGTGFMQVWVWVDVESPITCDGYYTYSNFLTPIRPLRPLCLNHCLPHGLDHYFPLHLPLHL